VDALAVDFVLSRGVPLLMPGSRSPECAARCEDSAGSSASSVLLPFIDCKPIDHDDLTAGLAADASAVALALAGAVSELLERSRPRLLNMAPRPRARVTRKRRASALVSHPHAPHSAALASSPSTTRSTSASQRCRTTLACTTSTPFRATAHVPCACRRSMDRTQMGYTLRNPDFVFG
jgi:hypothetical protein